MGLPHARLIIGDCILPRGREQLYISTCAPCEWRCHALTSASVGCASCSRITDTAQPSITCHTCIDPGDERPHCIHHGSLSGHWKDNFHRRSRVLVGGAHYEGTLPHQQAHHSVDDVDGAVFLPRGDRLSREQIPKPRSRSVPSASARWRMPFVQRYAVLRSARQWYVVQNNAVLCYLIPLI